MVKKVIVVLLVLGLSTVICFGAIGDNVIEPNYTTCNDPQCNLDISGGGVATLKGFIMPKSNSSVDKVTMNFKLDRVSGGTLLNETYNATWNSAKGGYYLEKNCNLVRNGIYEFRVVFKCYKNGQLVETISDVVAKREIY